MLNIYSEKENITNGPGKPMIKNSDIENVRRNLGRPLVQLNGTSEKHRQAVYKTPSLLKSSREISVNSPVTELANTFTELAAHEHQTTPKKRLSLGSGSPTPDFIRSKQLSPEFQYDYNHVAKPDILSRLQQNHVGIKTTPTFSFCGSRQNVSFRRFNSMPMSNLSPTDHEASPLLSTLVRSSQIERPFQFISPHEEESRESLDSGIGKEERFQFAVPLLPPEVSRRANESSPPLVHKTHLSSPIRLRSTSMCISPPDLHDNAANDGCDSPLISHKLCSSEVDFDDGFIDLDELESAASLNLDMPSELAPLLSGKLTTKHLNTTSCTSLDNVDGHKTSLFRSPSVPSFICRRKSPNDFRRRVFGGKRPEPPQHDSNTPQAANKKRRSAISEGNMIPNSTNADIQSLSTQSQPTPTSANKLLRCKSMIEHTIEYSLTHSSEADITGDFSRKCILPTVDGKHQDLRCISPHTMSQLLAGDFSESVTHYDIIDCRYPYEYAGGHIQGAYNIYTKDGLFERFLMNKSSHSNTGGDKRHVLIFHCEFSSERAPKLSRFLRNIDRDLNKQRFPQLHFPELYLLEGGYKAFFHKHQDQCYPQTYKPMLHKEHSEDLKKFRSKSKSWAGTEKRRIRPFRV